MPLLRTTAATLAGLLTLMPAAAQADRSPMEKNVARELRTYGFGEVDVDTLTSGQVAALHHILHSKRSTGDKRALIKSTLGGRNSLRGLFN